MPTLEVVVDPLKKVKDEANSEFKKVEGQVQNHIMFVTTGEEELLVLQITFGTHNTKSTRFVF
jgi:hypothetical protein